MNDTITTPKCVGFIMDGNRRWAKERDLDTLEGHQKGYEAFKDIVRYLRDSDINDAVFYAFSTENWNRSEREVGYLMKLFKKVLEEVLEDIEEEKVRVRIVGEREKFSKDLQELIEKVEEESKEYDSTTIWIALSYGGRAEIVDAVNRAVAKGEKVDEASFGKLLWTNGMPDPDLIVRTSGESRLSNFLLWQSVYSELFFVDDYWPDFTQEKFEEVLRAFQSRKRRKGV